MKKLLILGLVGILTSNGYVFSMDDMPSQKNVSKPIYISYNPQQDLFDKNKEELKSFTHDLLLNNNAIYEELFEYYNSGYSEEDIVMYLRSYCEDSLSDPKQSKLRDLLFVTNTEVEEAVDKILYNTFMEVMSSKK